VSLPTEGFAFGVTARDGHARCATFRTPRTVIETPAFMPVGTQATIKGLTPAEVWSTGARMVLANTYHLWIRPGAELVGSLGGVQRFMAWEGAVLTDSGGYQVFSLAETRTLDDDGVTFRSHLDGDLKRLTPEEAMRVQALLGADVAMVLDECPPAGAPWADVERAVRRTSAWARRCLAAPPAERQARFGIVQGGVFGDLRRAHLEDLASLPFDGLAMGGFSVGEPVETMYALLETLGPRMPEDRPRYLMGVGTPQDLVEAVGRGIDLFDCVLPTRNARNGQALTWSGRVNLRQARHRDDTAPLDARCTCPTCRTHPRAYLRHLFKAGEMLGPRLVTLHNLWFYGALMAEARSAIHQARYTPWAQQTLAQMKERDEVGPSPA
jgi:queuine tRNA-ribosyltransferase